MLYRLQGVDFECLDHPQRQAIAHRFEQAATRRVATSATGSFLIRNSIMMISHFEHLIRHEGQTWGIEAAVRGASERLTPVLMTAIVTALG